MKRLTPEAFWSLLVPDGDCLVWPLYCDENGYGRARFGTTTKMRTHRIAWTLAFGPLEPGQQVLHRCDNPPCCRPEHLFLGDPQANAIDRERKGRGSKHLSEIARKHPLEVIAEAARLRKAGRPIREVVEATGVSASHVSRLGRGL